MVLITLLTIGSIVGNVAAQSNVGILRLESFICPKQVAPSSNFQVTVDTEYGLYGANPSATIRSAIYNGPMNSTAPLWQSDMVNVSYVGEQLWNATLSSPSSEGYLNLTAYAFYLEGGVWRFFGNSSNGPGFEQAKIKVGKVSNLDVYVGAPSVSVSINGSTLTTSTNGDVNVNVPLNSIANINVPLTINFQNSTRGVFKNWNDANTNPQRLIMIDGDTRLTANYTLQYLLRINSPSSSEGWYNKGATVTLNASASSPMSWPLNTFGIQGRFTGWSGDIQSSLLQVNLTIDGPKNVNENYSFDYRPLALPVLFASGAIVLLLNIIMFVRRGRSSEGAVSDGAGEAEGALCPNCSNAIESEWTHCIKCGTQLTDDSSSKE
jgi:hypothetical protein